MRNGHTIFGATRKVKSDVRFEIWLIIFAMSADDHLVRENKPRWLVTLIAFAIITSYHRARLTNYSCSLFDDNGMIGLCNEAATNIAWL